MDVDVLIVPAAQMFGGCIWLSLGHYGERRQRLQIETTRSCESGKGIPDISQDDAVSQGLLIILSHTFSCRIPPCRGGREGVINPTLSRRKGVKRLPSHI